MNEIQPFPTVKENMETVAGMLLPALLTTLFFVFDVVGFSKDSFLTDVPFFLVCVYYWALYRPKFIPVWIIFCAGFLIDIVSFYMIGLSALMFCVVHIFVVKQRRFLMAQPFVLIWAGFAMILAGLYVSEILLLTAMHAAPIMFKEYLTSFFIGAASFPILSFFLHLGHKTLPRSSFDKQMTMKF